MYRLVLILALAGGLAGCGQKAGGPTGESKAATTKSNPAVAEVLALASPDALVTVVIDPSRWGAVVQGLSAVQPSPLRAEFESRLGTVPKAFQTLANEARVQLPAGVLELLDLSRPLVISFAEVRAGWRADKPGIIRHAAVIPTADPKAVVSAFTASFKTSTLTLKGGSGTAGLVSGWRVAVEALPKHVRITVEWANSMADFELSASTTKRPMTPAWRVALSGEAPVSVYLRSWRIRDVFTAMGTAEMAQVMDEIPLSSRGMVAMIGASIVATSGLVMTDENADFDDHTAQLFGGSSVLLRVVSSLTPAGARALDSATKAAPPARVMKETKLISWGHSRVDLTALVRAAVRPGWTVEARTPADIIRPLSECGLGCAMWWLTRGGRGLLRAGLELSDRIPGGAELTGFSWAFEGLRTSTAVVGTDASGGAFAQKALRGTEPLVVELVDAGSAKALVLGLGPKTLLEVGGEPSEVLFEAHLDAQRLLAMEGLPRVVERGLLKSIAAVTVEARRAGRALVTELRVDSVTGRVPALKALAAFTDPWPSPAPPASADLQRARKGIAIALRAIGSAAPGNRDVLLVAGLKETEPALKVAMAAGGYAAEEARRLHATLLGLAVDGMVANWRQAEAIKVLEAACTRVGVPAYCEQAKLVAVLVPKGLPVIDVQPARSEPGSSAARLEIGADGRLSSHGKALALTGVEGAEGLLQRMADSGETTVDLVVDAAVSFDKVLPVLQQLRGKFKGAHLIVQAGKKLARLPIGIPPAVDDGADPEHEVVLAPLAFHEGKKEAMAWPAEVDPKATLALLVPADTPARRWLSVVALNCGRRLFLTGVGTPDFRTTSAAKDAQNTAAAARFGELGGAFAAEPEAASTTGQLPPKDIKRTMRRQRKAIRYCYSRALMKQPDLAGRVDVEFVIGVEGRVTSVTTPGLKPAMADVGRCVATRVQRIRFAKPVGGPVTVKYPFIFKAN